jgi:hydrogenase-4 component F
MDMQILLFWTLCLPFATALILWFIPKNFHLLSTFHILGSLITSIVALTAVSNVIQTNTYFLFNKLFFLDSVGGVFLTLIAVIGFLINLYSVKYMQWEMENKHISINEVKLFYVLSHIFVFTMIFSIMSNNIALMWAGIEATTLSSLFMVALYKNKRATESGWKYIIICSVGLAFALYATVLMYGAGFAVIKDGHEAMLWSSLIANAKIINPDALKLIFIFALIGFGTKAGLAPMHTWLPDVHSEGPSPASAFLSAVLLKCALAAIIRYYAIVAHSTLGSSFVETLMVIVALLSIFIAAMFILKQRDIKRMFAYHSVEHVGIIAFGFGIGGPVGIFAGLFHSMAHSLSKALAFCVSGNIIRIYGTRDMEKMGGLIKVNPLNAVLFGIAVASLIGIPLLAIFVSEFLMIKSGLSADKYIQIALFIIGLSIIFIAVLMHFNEVVFGKVRGEVKTEKIEANANIPLIIFAVLIVALGIYICPQWFELLQNATKIILG